MLLTMRVCLPLVLFEKIVDMHVGHVVLVVSTLTRIHDSTVTGQVPVTLGWQSTP